MMSSTKRNANSCLDDSLTNIQWLCELESKTLLGAPQTSSRRNTTDESSSLNPHPKPPYSYATLILLAINSTQEKRMTLQDIYKWIEDNFPYYRKCKKAWKNSIRHNLSLHSFFLKAKRPATLPGKGSYWSISPEGKENIIKEVMKYQQPVTDQERFPHLLQTRGLRPILPKPSEHCVLPGIGSLMGSSGGVQVLSDGSLSGFPGRTIPVVILPTQVYMNMANKLAVQSATAAGAITGMAVNSAVSMATELTSSARALGENLDCKEKGTSSRTEGDAMVAKPSTDLGCRSMETTLGGEDITPGVDPVASKESKISNKIKPNQFTEKNTNNAELHDKKSRPNKRKMPARNRDLTSCSTLMAKPKSSPLRSCPQPTLAAINSGAHGAASPGSVFHGIASGANELGLISPVKPIVTPSKDHGNHSLLTPVWVSPLGSSSFGFNSHSGFTPLNYGSDSGIFTPLKEREFDCGFILSPETYNDNNICSTPHGCRKSLRLSFSKGDRTAPEPQWKSGYDSGLGGL